MNAHPQSPIPTDLESALKSYCSGEENFPEVLVVAQNEATTLSQTPRFVLDQPLDHITLYVKLDEDYNYEEVSTTTYDLDDRELIIFVGTSPQHPLHYFISHDDALGSRHPNRYGLFIKEGLMS